MATKLQRETIMEQYIGFLPFRIYEGLEQLRFKLKANSLIQTILNPVERS